MMQTHDLSFLFEPAELDTPLACHIEALAPLSITPGLGGNYFRSESGPTHHQLCGLLENLLGWHFYDDARKNILKALKKAKPWKKWFKENKAQLASGSGYQPLLGHLVQIEQRQIPPLLRFDDCWTMLQKHKDVRHFDGSRNNDWRVDGP